MTIGVTGATGQLGRKVVAQLRAATGEPVVALVRSPEKAAELGVEVRKADYADPATLTPALQGIDTLLLISSSEIGQREAQHKAVIAAAKEAGVARIVYTSLLNADASPLSLAPEHVATEAALRASGLEYTILRNGWYLENHLASVPAALAHGALVGAAGAGKIAAASRDDYAAAAVAVLTGGDHSGKTYELAGSVPFTLSELASEVSRVAGKEVPFVNMAEPQFAEVLEGAGLPPAIAAAVASWDALAAEGALFSDDDTLSTLIGRPTTPLAEAVEQALAA